MPSSALLNRPLPATNGRAGLTGKGMEMVVKWSLPKDSRSRCPTDSRSLAPRFFRSKQQAPYSEGTAQQTTPLSGVELQVRLRLPSGPATRAAQRANRHGGQHGEHE